MLEYMIEVHIAGHCFGKLNLVSIVLKTENVPYASTADNIQYTLDSI